MRTTTRTLHPVVLQLPVELLLVTCFFGLGTMIVFVIWLLDVVDTPMNFASVLEIVDRNDFHVTDRLIIWLFKFVYLYNFARYRDRYLLLPLHTGCHIPPNTDGG